VGLSAPLHFVLKSVTTWLKSEPRNDRMTSLSYIRTDAERYTGYVKQSVSFGINRVSSFTGNRLAVWRSE
jgi:hypothetical protein